MKLIIAGVVLAVVMGLVVQHRDSFLIADEALTYVKEEATLEVVPEPEEDTIEKARQELERINNELDTKEQELLKERDAIDAELERLRETRVSFQ